MASLSHRRTHNLLLISKLLNQRDHASPLTLVVDTLEQSAKPLLREYIRRAKLGKSLSVFLAFETVCKPEYADIFISCWDRTPVQISQAVTSAVKTASDAGRRCLVLVDSLSTLAAMSAEHSADFNLTAFLSSLLQPPPTSKAPIAISLVAVYHSDFPLVSTVPYMPKPLELVAYLATTIIHVRSLSTLLTENEARDRSLAIPSYGLEEGAEGILIGLKPGGKHLKPEHRGIVLELEHRRKSGRGVHEWYFLPSSASKQPATVTSQGFREITTLLDDHPLFRKSKPEATDDQEELEGMTFELGLTNRQRQEREGVVLPYFDAQKGGGGGGPGEGGRILYDMGAEDDFDDEEDEI